MSVEFKVGDKVRINTDDPSFDGIVTTISKVGPHGSVMLDGSNRPEIHFRPSDYFWDAGQLELIEQPEPSDNGSYLTQDEVGGLYRLLSLLNDSSSDHGTFGDLALGVIPVYDINGEPALKIAWNSDARSYVSYGSEYDGE